MFLRYLFYPLLDLSAYTITQILRTFSVTFAPEARNQLLWSALLDNCNQQSRSYLTFFFIEPPCRGSCRYDMVSSAAGNLEAWLRRHGTFGPLTQF